MMRGSQQLFKGHVKKKVKYEGVGESFSLSYLYNSDNSYIEFVGEYVIVKVENDQITEKCMK